MNINVLKIQNSSAVWERATGITVIDPDGWDRGAIDFNTEWNRPLSFEEFMSKVEHSTIERASDMTRSQALTNADKFFNHGTQPEYPPQQSTASKLYEFINSNALAAAFMVTAMEQYAKTIIDNQNEIRQQCKHAFIAPEPWINLAQEWQKIKF